MEIYDLDDELVSPFYNSSTGGRLVEVVGLKFNVVSVVGPRTLAHIIEFPRSDLCELYNLDGSGLAEDSTNVVHYNSPAGYCVRVRPGENLVSTTYATSAKSFPLILQFLM